MLTKHFINFLVNEPNPLELSKFLVHGGFSVPEPRGCAIALIDDEGNVDEVARYGIANPDAFMEKMPVWRNVPPFKAIRAGKPTVISVKTVMEMSAKEKIQVLPDDWMRTLVVIPIIMQRFPIGAVALFYDKELSKNPEFRIDLENFSGLTCMALQSLKLRGMLETNTPKLLPVMTDRQTQILLLIARGFTNKEIASELAMTVATVKQEVSRILTALDVSSRKEAVNKARAAMASGEI